MTFVARSKGSIVRRMASGRDSRRWPMCLQPQAGGATILRRPPIEAALKLDAILEGGSEWLATRDTA